MRCTILVLSLAIFYAAASTDDVVPEETSFALENDLSEAQATVDQMTAAGRSDKDCRKLVEDTRKGVKTNVDTCQKIMDALPRGDHCTNLGQGAVKMATDEKSKADKHVITCSTNVKKAASASVAFGSRTFSSLTEGKCSEFYSSATYTTAEANYNAAVTAHTKAKGAASEAATALKEAIAAAAKAKSECLCKTRSDHEKLFATHSASAKADQEAWTFANKVECVLDGKGNCPTVTAPKCKRPKVTSAVMEENCNTAAKKPAGIFTDDGYKFETCIQDCGTTARGTQGNRVCDDKQKGVKDPKECPKWCKGMGYKKFMLACPTAGSTECWCCNNVDKANGGKEHEKLATSECTGGKKTSGLNNNNNAHCSGTPTGTFIKHGYFLGGWCTGALYKI